MSGTEIYRTRSHQDCLERAFVLRAVAIEAEIAGDGENFILVVPQTDARAALEHLAAFARENRQPPPRRSMPVLHSGGLLGSAVYTAMLITIAWLASVDAGGRPWFETGRLEAARVRAGEVWRVVTALTLHADVGHLLSNLGFGALYGFFAARLIGPGMAWLAILLGGAFGNLANAWLQAPEHRSIGASTAVFAALGLLAAYSLRVQMTRGQSWAYRWGPLIGGIALLGFTGTGGENTDVTAHGTGFVAGAVLGLGASYLGAPTLARVALQRATATLALALVIGAWVVGLWIAGR